MMPVARHVFLGFTHARRNIALVHNCNELVLRSKCNFQISVHHVFGHAGKAGNECANIAASLGMRGFISESNVLSCWPHQTVPCAALAECRCLSGVAEVLHSMVAGIAVEIPLCLFQLFSFSEASCCTQSACWVFRYPTPSSGFRCSWRTRSNRR